MKSIDIDYALLKNYAYFKYLLKYLSYNKYEIDIINEYSLRITVSASKFSL